MGIEEKHLRNFILEKSYPTSSGGAVSGHLSASCGSQSKALQIYAYGKQGKIHTRKQENKEREKIKRRIFTFVSQFVYCS